MSIISELHKKLWKVGMGSVSASEGEFLSREIVARKPKTFVEIGTATGLSSVLIDAALQQTGGGTLVTIDLHDVVFGDKSKATGYLLDELGNTRVKRITGKTSFDLSAILGDLKIDMAFIDAAHWQPWPVIDTLMIWPFLSPGAVLFHHDLRLYQKYDGNRGIGPKYVFDQFPDSMKMVIPEDPDRNMFYVTNNLSLAELGDRMADALYLPWQAPKVDRSYVDLIRARLEAFYPPKAAQAFAVACQRFA